ncbi:hypothetical protein [Catellatospora methionotrophica]|uniref:hypothetical protein n=1 Tax=Catellatospora methionotrophica TaxID=121620 RepID=UPI00140ABBA2|nr:hypothetical protein [Catellatospora methionotrophica]
MNAVPTTPRARAIVLTVAGLLLIAGAWWYGRTTPIHPMSADEADTVWLIVLGAGAAIARSFHLMRHPNGRWRQGAADGEPGLVLTPVSDRVLTALWFAVQLPIIARWARLDSTRELWLAIGWTLLALGLLWVVVRPAHGHSRQVVLNASGVRVHRRHVPWSQVRSARLNSGAGVRLETADGTVRLRGADYRMRDGDVAAVLQYYYDHPERRGDLAHLDEAPPELRSS